MIFQNGTEEQFYYDDNDFYILGSTDSIDGISKVNRRLINRYTGEGIMDHYRLNDQEDGMWHEKMSETMIKETLISGSENYNEEVANRKNHMWYYWYKSLDQFEIVKSVTPLFIIFLGFSHSKNVYKYGFCRKEKRRLGPALCT